MRFALVVLIAATVLAQQPAFEVVSIKPRDPNTRPAPPSADAGMVRYPNVTLKTLISRAYGVPPYRIDGPGWLDDFNNNSFTFSAKLPEGATREQVPAMLQTMLAERFELKIHRESKLQSVYVLVVGKDGPKLKKSDIERAPKSPDGRALSTLEINSVGHFTLRMGTLPLLAQMLSDQLGRPVLDQTNIEGTYDIEFDSNPNDIQTLRSMAAAGDFTLPDNSTASSLFTGVQSLGLKLEARKMTIEHIVIDHALKTPTEN
jgi:uncharacterized protein (TIGR03435 family)